MLTHSALFLLSLQRRFDPVLSFSRSSSKNHAQRSGDLSQVYQDIAQQANQLERWPDSAKFCEECLVYNPEKGTYNLPHFVDGHGPIGIFGFLNRNPIARSILDECDKVFDEFCVEVQKNICASYNDNDGFIENWILQSPKTSHHVTVAILQEHPSFLRDPTDIANWQPLSEETIQCLSGAFEQQHHDNQQHHHDNQQHESGIDGCPELELDSVLWTPDGAMIAGFVDINNTFDTIRQSYRNIAQKELGDLLTTRPKNLIHVTIGRIVGLPPGASNTDYDVLRDLSLLYNTKVFPTLVQKVVNEESHGGRFRLDELSLARNTIWMLQEYVEYSRWSIQGYQ